ncbi:MAG: sulfate ABC transporter permease subunit CysT, partial [Burkholderia sp.]|nr:sulfate ABC transporter permease subunit CysT [Burkholderia sp.]
LVVSFLMLLLINTLQWYLQRRTSKGASGPAPATVTVAAAGGQQ